MEARRVLVAVLLLLLAGARTASARPPIEVEPSSSVLAGPWRFAVGDDPRWAAAAFDDRNWQTVFVGGSATAHDPDVGLGGYGPGWAAHGHAGYTGFAWYRARFRFSASVGKPLAIAGPADVDDAYQLYVDGRLLGGIGDFTGFAPVAYSIRPHIYSLGPARSGSYSIAIRTWMGPPGASDPQAGGMHIAPLGGDADTIDAHVRLQWLELLRGFVLEVVQALVFVALAVMALSLAFGAGSSRAACGWLALALVLSAFLRANLAFFSWTPYESVAAFSLAQSLLLPAWFGAWAAAELAWLPQRGGRIVAMSIGAATIAYGAAQLAGNDGAVTDVRLAFLALFAIVAARGAHATPRIAAAVLPPFTLVCVGLFAAELSQLGVPEIWFPYGTGVSRTQFAYAAFDIVAFAVLEWYLATLLLRRPAAPPISS